MKLPPERSNLQKSIQSPLARASLRDCWEQTRTWLVVFLPFPPSSPSSSCRPSPRNCPNPCLSTFLYHPGCSYMFLKCSSCKNPVGAYLGVDSHSPILASPSRYSSNPSSKSYLSHFLLHQTSIHQPPVPSLAASLRVCCSRVIQLLLKTSRPRTVSSFFGCSSSMAVIPPHQPRPAHL